jgi:hypothetical protein
MRLERKREIEIIPQYSLTGDLLSFLRCGLMYRYHGGSELPPSRPVQLWFGEFIHGVLESAYRAWKLSAPQFPWPSNPTQYRQPAPTNRAAHDIGLLGDVVEGTLRARGKNPRSGATRDSAYRRVERAINELGPHLFPLISSAEEAVIGTRFVPPAGPGMLTGRARMYELHGIIDVLTDIQLTTSPSSNIIKQALQNSCPTLNGRFEVIVDYKGSRRPPMNSPYWKQGDWQLQTYAWLRMRQPNALPVAAGVLLYVNELNPGTDDLSNLRNECNHGTTDVVPPNGSLDSYQLNTWRPQSAMPSFSEQFRMQRAIRVIPIDAVSQKNATQAFDSTVLDIEQRVAAEAQSGTLVNNWTPCGDEETCAACDFRHFCPDPAPRNGKHITKAPPAP